MSLLSLRNVGFTFGGPPLLAGVDLEIDKRERIGLLGRNGAGKSTLMRIIAGEIEPDSGTIRRANGLRVGRLVQDVPDRLDDTVAAVVAQGGVEFSGGVTSPIDELETEDWKLAQAVERLLSRMNLDGEATFATLSSGMKRRTLLAASLLHEPDVLLLDEPTNHLDIESISWLEQFLSVYAGTLLFVTHDRVFLQRLATRILEIDRSQLFDWTCDYPTFLQRRQAAWDAEDRQNELFDQKLAEEEKWIRQGIKARRTRNEGRVRTLKEMRVQRQQRRNRIGNVQMQAADSQRSGQLVLEAKNVSFSYGKHQIVRDFSTLITRGDKLGLIGPNGSGKTTLLKLLLGELQPDSGTIRRGTKFEVIYFDQLREQIDEEKTVVENVGEGQDMLQIDGRNQHIYGYLQNFLFTPERARRPARSLSGGERNRLLLARLFKRTSNVMVLDEPTNDLDTETLELLEELVANYAGTLLLVSHDRAFLNNVVTGLFAFEADGRLKEYSGGYDDYLRQKKEAAETNASPSPSSKKNPESAASVSSSAASAKTNRLTFKQRRELESLPERIDVLEQELGKLHRAMSDPAFFKQNAAEIKTVQSRLQSLEEELNECLSRWEELESQESGSAQE